MVHVKQYLRKELSKMARNG